MRAELQWAISGAYRKTSGMARKTPEGRINNSVSASLAQSALPSVLASLGTAASLGLGVPQRGPYQLFR